MKSLRVAVALAVLTIASGAYAADSGPKDECLNPGDNALLKEGCAALDAFMKTFNSRDGKAWAATLHFPHARIAGNNQLQVWETPEEYAKTNDVAELVKAKGWDHTDWTTRKLVQQGEDKLHFVTQFTRFDKDNNPIGTYDSLYIVTKKDGRWSTQFRSSFVGIVGKKTAF